MLNEIDTSEIKVERKLPENYKTRRCRNQWMNCGYCSYEEKCLFAHNINELRVIKQTRENRYTNRTNCGSDVGLSNLNYVSVNTCGCDIGSGGDIGSCDFGGGDCILL